MTHAAAKSYCHDRKAHLVEVLNQEQLDFIRMQLQVLKRSNKVHLTGGVVPLMRQRRGPGSGLNLRLLLVISSGEAMIQMVERVKTTSASTILMTIWG